MRPSLCLANAAVQHTRKPLIQFVGKRQWPSNPEPQHPHPAAPDELKQSFSNFLNKFKSSLSASGSSSVSSTKPSTEEGSSAQVYSDYWQAPQRLWKHDISEAEMDAITSGGASLH